VDKYRDHLSERLLAGMTSDPRLIAANIQFVLATRYLERIADHATNIAEDTIFWVRGLDVRHGRTLAPPTPAHPAQSSAVTENSSTRDTPETPSR
jgi:phosphate transport system protein